MTLYSMSATGVSFSLGIMCTDETRGSVTAKLLTPQLAKRQLNNDATSTDYKLYKDALQEL